MNKLDIRTTLACACLLLHGLLPAVPVAARPAGPADPVRTSPAAEGVARGAGSFRAMLADGKTVEVFTYRASGHGPHDPVVIVLAGGGRNGDDYRDSWIDAADRFNLLVLAPSFDEAQYPGPINYNLAGMIPDGADVATLRNVSLTPQDTWLFSDIEAIFDEAVARSGSARTDYDLFGHSAGGQIVHRMVLFAPEARFRTALAANSGWYTTTERDVPFPYGLGGVPLPPRQIERAFGRRLVIFLGELDNSDETRGQLRETPETAAQGPHRLARGRRFHTLSQGESARLGLQSAWTLEVVPGVGHDFRKMSEAAAEYLYGD